jgi:hypothetical protein
MRKVRATIALISIVTTLLFGFQNCAIDRASETSSGSLDNSSFSQLSGIPGIPNNIQIPDGNGDSSFENNLGESQTASGAMSDSDACDTMWANMRKQYPQDRFTKFETTSSSGVASEEILVLESNEDNIVVEITNDYGYGDPTTETQEFSKASMCASMNNNSGTGDMASDSNVDYEILVQRQESVTTEAGTFETSYLKAKTTSDYGYGTSTTISEMWTSTSLNLVVLSVSESDSGYGVSESRRELVELRD